MEICQSLINISCIGIVALWAKLFVIIRSCRRVAKVANFHSIVLTVLHPKELFFVQVIV